MTERDLSPITVELGVRCTPEQAFAVYTGRLGEWWDRRYTADAATLERVTVEPRIGGRLYATHSGTGDDDWGEVLEWEPGRRLVHTFTLAQDPGCPTEVAVDFAPAPEGAGSTVRLAHGGWTEANAAERGKFSDWRVLLDRFAALATGAPSSRARREARS